MDNNMYTNGNQNVPEKGQATASLVLGIISIVMWFFGSGFGAVIFPNDSFAISNVKLFPIQLVEALALMLLSLLIWYQQIYKEHNCAIEIYGICYPVLRFFLEFFRYDSIRGKIGYFSTSQWIGLVILFLIIIYILTKKKQKLSFR